MTNSFTKLISIASRELEQGILSWDLEYQGVDESRVQELGQLLSERNGFYAFESALHVFPAVTTGDQIGLDLWNSESLWKLSYDKDLVENCLFFAEDIFGVQFCICGEYIWSFDPETGQKEPLANNLRAWADSILADYEALTGYPLAIEWQRLQGPLEHGKRLIPKVPFVLGGEYTVENLYALEAVRGMQLRGELARQIRNLPDGTRVGYEITE
jgi:hypothetical protein